MAALTTDVHFLTRAGVPDVLREHPRLRRARHHVIPHGDYRAILGEVPSKTDARERLGLGDRQRVLVTFGSVKPYKGIDQLLTAFGTREDETMRLIVAGRAQDPKLAAEIAGMAAADAGVEMIDSFLSDEQLATIVRASDAVVLPYRQVLNSGSALLALTLHRRVLLPRTPTFEALAKKVGGGWIETYQPPLRAADLEAFASHGEVGEPDLSWCSWARISDLLAALWHDSPDARATSA